MGGKDRREGHEIFLSLATLAVAAFGISSLGYGRPARVNSAPESSSAAEWARTSIWDSATLPEIIDSGDPAPTEVGVKFRTHKQGWITAIRFYKASANTGRHVATLWSATGAKLASAPFTNETSSGWQQVTFTQPVALEVGATYIASYHTDRGHFSADPFYFIAGRDNGTLEALQDGTEGGNGVYEYGQGSVFPTENRRATNYWVDVVFVPTNIPAGDTYLPWEGGSAYYRRWHNGPSPNGDPGFFPIGVWDQDPSNAEGYKALGVNLFVALSRESGQAQLATGGLGLFFLGAENLIGRADARNKLLAAWAPVTKAWGQIDEPDNAQELPGEKGYGPCVPSSEVIEVYKRFRENDPTRPVYLGVGKSVDDTVTHMRGVCTGHYSDYPVYFQGADIVSYDSYPVNVHKPLWYVGKGMDRLRAWAGYRKLAYEAMETTRLEARNPKPTPDEVKSEVWMAIIHGGMGIIYFCHVFTPKFDEAGLLHDPVMAEAVAALDRQIASLAPVLNTPSVANGVRMFSSNANTPVDMMLKRWQGSTYLFAVAARPGGPTSATFTLRDFPPQASAFVLEEGRQVEITNGTFQDDFLKAYEVHIYRMGFNPANGKASAGR